MKKFPIAIVNCLGRVLKSGRQALEFKRRERAAHNLNINITNLFACCVLRVHFKPNFNPILGGRNEHRLKLDIAIGHDIRKRGITVILCSIEPVVIGDIPPPGKNKALVRSSLKRNLLAFSKDTASGDLARNDTRISLFIIPILNRKLNHLLVLFTDNDDSGTGRDFLRSGCCGNRYCINATLLGCAVNTVRHMAINRFIRKLQTRWQALYFNRCE